jgi:Tfp pilus assembly protein PilN
MKTLHLDFLRGRRPGTPGQWVMVGVLVFSAAAMAVYGLQLQNSLVQRGAQLEKISHGATRPRQSQRDAQPPAQLAEALKSGDRVSRQLNIPWEQLFKGLEASQFKDVALLEVQPDVTASRVRITAEARHQDALRDYMKTLWGVEDFSGVYLVRQKINDKVAENPVQFTLDARWKLGARE